MGPSEKIGKSIMNMVDTIKDSIGTKLVEAVSSGKLKVDQSSIPFLIAVINSTIDAGYHQSSRILEREISAILAAPPQPAAKKKMTSR